MRDPGGQLAAFDAQACRLEVHRIAEWWTQHSWNSNSECFYGAIDNRNKPDITSEIGVVLVARILWFFSEATRTCDIPNGDGMARRAFDLLFERFLDPIHGGLFWTLEADGRVGDCSKKTYAQAFGIYAACAYHRLSGDERAKTMAVHLFGTLEDRCRDHEFGGYLEAFARDWSHVEDQRLSELDLHAPKSMNAHLHVLEAYAALHSAFGTETSRTALAAIIELFAERVVEPGHRYLNQFFDIDWTVQSAPLSHGHDIEASWLLWKAAESLGCHDRMNALRAKVVGLAEHCLGTATLPCGGVANETHPDGRRDDTSIWWVQAEGLVGYLNAFELAGDARYLEAARACWRLIQTEHIDFDFGEWRWTAHSQDDLAARPYKAGMWKGPYHNGRAMLEGMERLARLDRQGTASE